MPDKGLIKVAEQVEFHTHSISGSSMILAERQLRRGPVGETSTANENARGRARPHRLYQLGQFGGL